MNYERERTLAERHAQNAMNRQDWPGTAYHLFNAARMTLRMADSARGRTRNGLVRLAKAYESRGDQALRRAARNGRSGKAVAEREDRKDEGASWILAEKPATRLADVAGMEDVKEIIENHILLPMRHAELYAEYSIQPGSGVLMYGPPGTGKTFIARAIAGELDAAFIPVEMGKVLSKWFGETEQLLTHLFDEARKHPRAIIFFDEAESLFPKRSGTNSSVMARVVPQLLQLINGLDPSKNILVLMGATNRPWLMDEAALRPGRFGKLVYVGPPDHAARGYMIQHALRETPSEGLDFDALASLAEGYSGADIAGEQDSVCVEAKMSALKRTLENDESVDLSTTAPQPVTMEDFTLALTKVQPSIKPSDLEQFRKFKKE